MPKLATINAPPALRKTFDDYYEITLVHEKHHGQIAKTTAEDINSNLLNLVEYTHCHDLHKDASQLADSFIRKMQFENKQYDIRTNNGKTEGVDIDRFVNGS